MSTQAKVNLVILRQIITHKFNKSELRDLCFDLQINHESLPGDTIEDMARELVIYVHRRDRVYELLDLCQQKRPQVNWAEEVLVRLSSLPQDLQQAVDSRYVGVRQGSINELEHFLRGADKQLAAAARAALEQLASDDSRRVSAAAVRALEAYESAGRAETAIRLEQEPAAGWQERVEPDAAERSPEPRPTKSTGAQAASRLAATIALETLGGVATPLIQRDAALPAEATQTFSTAADGQTQVDVHLLFGNSESAADNVSLGKFALDGIPSAPRGIPQITVRIGVDADLQMSVSATDQATGRTQSIGQVDLSAIDLPASDGPVGRESDQEAGFDWSQWAGSEAKTRTANQEELEQLFGGQGGFSDFFEAPFGRRRQTAPGADLQVEMTISFIDAVLGAEKELIFERPELCPGCGGTGAGPGGAEPGGAVQDCQTCQGMGEVRAPRDSALGTFVHVSTCPDCGGSGKRVKDACRVCNGRRLVQKRRSLRVKIPAGVKSGSKLRLQGQGAQGKDSPDGSLYVNLQVEPHPFFEREDQDIILSLPLTPGQARSGGTIQVPTVDGNVKLTVPANAQHGQRLVVKGKGVPALREPAKRGDQVVRLVVAEPDGLASRDKLVFEQTNKSFKRKRW